ncbi:MAG: type II toxin-antitoxin system VapC family toxin [Planctomycetes bacterium]|nr:type II toxin-antitoxin system VapC family toxin [Planctomycetota bacterium]
MNPVKARMDFITDTHSLVWYFTEDARLSKKAIKAFEGTIKEGTVVVPAVVLAEIMYISKRGKIALTFEETLQKIEEYENFDIAPLDINILKTADRIETDMEMHDKLIVATALYYKARLITMDEQIKKAGIVPVVW